MPVILAYVSMVIDLDVLLSQIGSVKEVLMMQKGNI